MREADLQRAILLAASAEGHRLFRNNTGMLPDARGIPVHFGLGEGSGDLIGWTRTGLFASVEVKGEGARTAPKRLRAQEAWRDAVLAAGGRAVIAYSVEQALEALA